MAARQHTGVWLPHHSPASGHFQFCELRPQRLLADRSEPDDKLHVVVERFDSDDGSDTELRVADAQAGLEARRRRLILVLVGIDRLLFPGTSTVATPLPIG